MRTSAHIRSASVGFAVIVLSAAAAGCSGKNPEGTGCPGFIRQSGNVYLMENHCHALPAWHREGVSNATLVHVDAHDDCRPVSSSKTERIRQLLESKDYSSLFNESDTWAFLSLRKRSSDLLYDLGNFIFPAMELGIVSNVYWVVPQPLITDLDRLTLAALMMKSLDGSAITETQFPAGGFELEWKGRLFRILTYEDLPDLPAGCLLDIDIDVFAFPRAMTEDHLVAQVNRNPDDVLRYVRDKVPEPEAVTISASVWGGYLPLMLRFLADASFDFFTDGTFPEDARTLLAAYRSIRDNTPQPLASPREPTYAAAFLHFSAMVKLSHGDIEACRTMMEEAAKLKPVYKKGLLDAAEGLISMTRPEDALALIDNFEHLSGGVTYNSIAVRALAFLKSGDTNSALQAATRLTDWERNPYTLLIYGSALTACGKPDEAKRVFTDLAEIAPNHAPAHFNLGLLEQQAGNTNAAIREYREAIEIRPGFWQAQENLGHILLEGAYYEQAEQMLQAAIKANPYSVASLNNLGLALLRQKRYDEALAFFDRALALKPGETTLQLNLAEALYRSGDKAGAAEALSAVNDERAKALLRIINSSSPGAEKD